MDSQDERQIVRPKLVKFGFFNDAFGVEEESAIALDGAQSG